MIISLSGYGGAGKDSLAEVLVEEHGFKQYAWADTLRLAASILNPVVGVYLDGQLFDFTDDRDRVGWRSTRVVRYNDAVEQDGYIAAKAKYPDLREFLQLLGTEVGRNLISDNVWVDATFARIERECGLDADIVITDTRFPNEADAIRQRGGYLVRVDRPGVGPVNEHPSETSLEGYKFDYYALNNGTLADLPYLASDLLEKSRNFSLALASS